MGYRIPWARRPEAERQRYIKAATTVESRRRAEFKAQLAEIEAENARREADLANRDLVSKL